MHFPTRIENFPNPALESSQLGMGNSQFDLENLQFDLGNSQFRKFLIRLGNAKYLII